VHPARTLLDFAVTPAHLRSQKGLVVILTTAPLPGGPIREPYPGEPGGPAYREPRYVTGAATPVTGAAPVPEPAEGDNRRYILGLTVPVFIVAVVVLLVILGIGGTGIYLMTQGSPDDTAAAPATSRSATPSARATTASPTPAVTETPDAPATINPTAPATPAQATTKAAAPAPAKTQVAAAPPVKRGPSSAQLSLPEACKQVTRGQTQRVAWRVRDPNSLVCVNPGVTTEYGRLQIAPYCADSLADGGGGGGEQKLINDNTAWSCGDRPINDLSRVCEWQFNTDVRAVPDGTDPTPAYNYTCTGPQYIAGLDQDALNHVCAQLHGNQTPALTVANTMSWTTANPRIDCVPSP
jgi:hypothetical protein